MSSIDSSYPPSAVATVGRSLQAFLVPFPAVCFTLALLTDIAFWQTSLIMWQNFSAWLLFAGLVFGALAVVAAAIDFLFRKVRAVGSVWPRVVGGLIVLVLALVNSLVHAGDGWTAVVPYGLILSAVTVLVVVITALVASPLVVRRGVGVKS